MDAPLGARGRGRTQPGSFPHHCPAKARRGGASVSVRDVRSALERSGLLAPATAPWLLLDSGRALALEVVPEVPPEGAPEVLRKEVARPGAGELGDEGQARAGYPAAGLDPALLLRAAYFSAESTGPEAASRLAGASRGSDRNLLCFIFSPSHLAGAGRGGADKAARPARSLARSSGPEALTTRAQRQRCLPSGAGRATGWSRGRQHGRQLPRGTGVLPGLIPGW